MILRSLLLSLALLPLSVEATQYKPWLDVAYMPIWRNWYTYQFYNRVDTQEGHLHIHGQNHLLDSSLAMAIGDEYDAEAEWAASQSRIRDFSFEGGRITGRIHLSSDIMGDALSLVAGATITGCTNRSLHDFNLLYHGLVEYELHLSFGREITYYDTWLSRWWGVVAIGIADRGSPWMWGKLTWEKNICEQQQFTVYIESGGGFGDHSLSLQRRFDGYGGIAYRFVDLGALYHYVTDCWGTFSLGYGYRPYGCQLPCNVQQATISWRYDFSL